MACPPWALVLLRGATVGREKIARLLLHGGDTDVGATDVNGIDALAHAEVFAPPPAPHWPTRPQALQRRRGVGKAVVVPACVASQLAAGSLTRHAWAWAGLLRLAG